MGRERLPLISPDTSYVSRPDEFISRTRKIADSLAVAVQGHEGQRRLSGEPYVHHCISVASILESWGIKDENLISAALLHDVIEDSTVTLQEIAARFGKETAELVNGVSKFRSETGEYDDRETLKKVLIKSYIDPRVAILKLADRLHNMLTLDAMPRGGQVAKARETLDVYAELAESLGIWVVKTQLEDLAFKYVSPESFEMIKKELDSDSRMDPRFIHHWRSNLQRLLEEKEIKGGVEVRRGGYWSLAKKRERSALQGKSLPTSFADINDVISFRVRLEDINDCYRFIGNVHERFGDSVDFERYDEFIGANKRENGYQALQTTLNLSQGALEIAAMAEQMEEFNNWGVVSLVGQDETELNEYILKLVFTPIGEVRFLPREATGIDFAYSINERLGAEADYILVDGEKKPLTFTVPNASVVEVVLAKEVRRAPDPKLLRYCLPSTKRVIKEQLIQREKDRFTGQGKRALEEVLAKRGLLDLADLGEPLPGLIYRFGCQTVDDLYFKVGRGYLDKGKVSEWFESEGITKKTLGWSSIRVEGLDKPGILDDLASWIRENGGNIVNIGLRMISRHYELRLVIEKLTFEAEEAIGAKLSGDERFESWRIV